MPRIQKIEKVNNPKGTLIVSYELYLEKQFDILWNKDNEGKKS